MTILGTNDLDKTITVMIKGKRYEYWLNDFEYVEQRWELEKRKRSQQQQLQWIKTHSKEYKLL